MPSQSQPVLNSAHHAPVVLTVGHSTHPIEKFIEIVKTHGVSGILDIRTVPRSRHNPQFNTDALPLFLNDAGIGYAHLPGLGGLRHSRPGSENTGWRNASFRGFADYMQTIEFEQALADVIAAAQSGGSALMCAEAVPWRCHRSLIADALAARGVRVWHILNRQSRKEHALTPFARVLGTRITYPAPSSGDR